MWRPPNLPDAHFYFLGKHGWPVERVSGQPIRNFFRLLIHTRKITTSNWWIDSIVDRSNRIWEDTMIGGSFLPYIQIMRPPEFDVGDPSQRKIGGRSQYLDYFDENDMMKPEED